MSASTVKRASKSDGWILTLMRAAGSSKRRLRDAIVARRLRTQDFHCGQSPRLLGLAHMSIGRGFRAGDHAWLHAIAEYEGREHTPQLVIGARFTASDNLHVACLHVIRIGEDVLVGSRVIISDHAHGVYRGDAQSAPDTPPVRRPLSSTGEIRIGANVWIGDGVAILGGASIGDGAVIGANSVVTGTIPSATIAVGTPARPVREWNGTTATWDRIGAV